MRAAIRRELESINPLDALERQHRSEALAWVDSGAPLFRTAKPATPPQHLVSYFAVIDGDSILLVDHKNAQLWLPPGGHVEVDEHPRDTVGREVREELGFTPAHAIEAPLMVTCTTTVTVRKAEERDLASVLALYRELRPHDPVLAPGVAREAFATLLARRDVHLVVCEAEGTLAATCMLAIIPNLASGARPFGVIEHVVTLLAHESAATRALSSSTRWRRRGPLDVTKSSCCLASGARKHTNSMSRWDSWATSSVAS
jgi:ADP-ribose pyrophosphatase YjhB (NUDIX family)